MSNSIRRMMVQVLRDLGAVVHRQGKHEVWRLPSGALFSVPRSPSDCHALKNMKSSLRRVGRSAAARG